MKKKICTLLASFLLLLITSPPCFAIAYDSFQGSCMITYTDNNGQEVVHPQITDVYNASADVYINMGKNEDVILISVVIMSGVLNRVSVQPYSLISGANHITVQFKDLNGMKIDNENNKISLFVCNDLNDIRPIPLYDTSKQPMMWNNLPIGGGGYIVGIVAHPTVPEVIYCRTDIGGLYKMNTDGSWKQLLGGLDYTERNLYGIDGVALDPGNENVIYIAAGKYDYNSPCDVLKSTDGGTTWNRTNLNKKISSNGNWRWCGEPIAVNPNNSNEVWVITRTQGLYRSLDGGVTWQQVVSFTDTGTGRIVQFNPLGNKIYIGVESSGIYCSSDGGISWQFMTGSPSVPTRMDFDSNGTLYVSASTGVYKCTGTTWQTITPSTSFAAYGGVSVNPSYNNKLVAVSQTGNGGSAYGNHVFISNDGGASWMDTNGISQYTYHAGWDAAKNRKISSSSCVIFNPFNNNQLLIGDWYGVWMCDNIYADTVSWVKKVKGIEETVGFTFACPPSGTTVFAGVADLDGFSYKNIDTLPANSIDSAQVMQHMTGIDYCEKDPTIVARVGGNIWNSTSYGYISTNNGVSWTQMGSYLKTPSGASVGGACGKIAVAADKNANGKPTLLAVADGTNVCYSTDYGTTWTASAGLPAGISGGGGPWNWGRQIASDRVNKNYFYTFSATKFYASSDGGISFSEKAVLPWSSGSNVKIYAAPEKEGEVWILSAGNYIYKSSNYGSTFTPISGFTQPIAMCFGKNPPQNPNPAVYVYGCRQGVWGVYMSFDMGKNWIQVNGENKMSDEINNMEGDKQRFGVVYVSTNGTGLFYGEPVSLNSIRIQN